MEEKAIFDKFEENGVPPELYLTEWIVAFGCYIIPLKYMVRLLSPSNFLARLLRSHVRPEMAILL